ncbi:MAG: hypothetical protein AB8G05_07585 [Oligoflexales bacterium]
MKKLLLAYLLLGFIASNSAANPLIVKTNSPGYVHPDYSRSEICNLYVDRVEIKRTYGRAAESSFNVNQVIPLTISSELPNILAKANGEGLQSDEVFICDAPSTSIVVNLEDKAVTLFNSGGCGSPRLERVGRFSSMLVDLINQYCPKTYDFHVNN